MKEAIATSYMNEMKKKYGKLPSAQSNSVLLTGDQKNGSIGAAIRIKLEEEGMVCESFMGDVRTCCSFKSVCDTLIMCHGTTYLNWIEDDQLADNSIKEIIDVNLYGSILMVRNFVRCTMDLNIRKKIISIGSMAYKSVLNGSSVYCASKAGLAHFMKCVAWELAPKGYDIYSIHPSNTIGTPMTEETIMGLMNYRNLSREQATSYWSSNNPREEFLSTIEIADLVSFLLSGKAPYLSGSQLELSGGQR